MTALASASTRSGARRTVPAASSGWYQRALARYPLLSAQQELEAARGVAAAELAFWLAVLEEEPAFHLLTELDARMSSEVGEKKLSVSGWRELWRACDELTASRPGRAGRPSSQHLQNLAKAVRQWDVNRQALQLALAWVEARTPDRSAGSAAREVAYRRAVRRAHRAQVHAKQRFATANLRLVVMIAGQHQRGGLPLEDLIQEGNIGLMTAVERFDPDRGLRFSTYATYWIRHTIRRAITDKSQTVRVPCHRQEQTRLLARATDRVMARTGRTPAGAELAQELHWSERRVRELQERSRFAICSLQRPLAGTEGDTFLDCLADPDAIPADEALAASARARALADELAELRPVDAHILRCRFGLDGAEETTLLCLGDELKLSRERVRQRQHAALQELRRRIEARPGRAALRRASRGAGAAPADVNAAPVPAAPPAGP